MRRVLATTLWLALGLPAWMAPAGAQEVERVFCDDSLPANNCPGADCLCTDDRIAVAFPLIGFIHTSVFRYNDFVAGTLIRVEVVLDVRSADMRGWSYGVRHDPAVLELIPGSLNSDGTLLDPTRPDTLLLNGLNDLSAVENGFIQGTILSFTQPNAMPIGRHVVARATYRLIADAGVDGTRLQVTSDLGRNGATVAVALTIGDQSREPRQVADAIVRRVEVPLEVCDNGVDDDGDRLIDGEDPECQVCVCPPVEDCLDYAFYFGDSTRDETVDAVGQASFSISSRNIRPLFGFQLGAQATDTGGTRTYRFSGELGTDADRLVELLMTDDEGNSQVPVAGNQLVTSQVRIASVERGAATAPFQGGDFLQYDLEPGVGGPGFFAGYVSDLDDDTNQIPATPPTDGSECPLNELLIVRLEAPDGECPGFAFYFGREGVEGEIDGRGASSYSISTTNARPLLGFQFGVRTTAVAGGAVHEFAGDLGTDGERPVEILMTDRLGNSITPATPNTLLADTAQVADIRRGAATSGFAGGDFLAFDLEPGIGGPGFFVGYVSDLDGDENMIPATEEGSCFLNEVLVVLLESGDVTCPGDALFFGSRPVAGEVDAMEDASFAISSRNRDPLFGFQFGVRVTGGDGEAVFEFSEGVGTSSERLVEILFTNDRGESVFPKTPNTLRARTVRVRTIERGAATAAFAGEDFLAFDLDPGVGGPGFFAGYVSDLASDQNKIPATEGEGCPLNELLVVQLDVEPVECPGFALYFGPRATTDPHDARQAESFAISGRNERGLFGFQFGVGTATEAGETSFEFTGSLGTDPDRLVEVLMTDILGDSVVPETPNRLVSDTGRIASIRRGSALEGFAGGDFFHFDTAPGTGTGFFVGYVSDLDDDANFIPPSLAAGCALHELLVVELARDVPFSRGDADGNTRVNVSDAVLILQALFGNLPRRFDCEELFDADNDGELLISDGIFLLMWKFQAGDPLPPPFLACDIEDPDDGDALGCVESNCVAP